MCCSDTSPPLQDVVSHLLSSQGLFSSSLPPIERVPQKQSSGWLWGPAKARAVQMAPGKMPGIILAWKWPLQSPPLPQSSCRKGHPQGGGGTCPSHRAVQNQHILPWVWGGWSRGGGSGQWWDHKGAPRQKGNKHPTLSWVSGEKILILPMPSSGWFWAGGRTSHTPSELLVQTHRWCQCHQLYPRPQHHLPPVCTITLSG